MTLAAFLLKWNLRFANNTTGEIEELDMREFTADIAELFNIAADASVFPPYDPAKVYTKATPDFVSHVGQVWEYVNNTPAAGKTPGGINPQPVYWVAVTPARFAHMQNSDLGARNYSFWLSYLSQNQSIDGTTILGFETQQGGRKCALGLQWYNDGNGTESYAFRVCMNYTAAGPNVWEDLGGSGNFKGAYADGIKKVGEFWVTAAGIFRVKQNFTSASAPTISNAWWELIFSAGVTSVNNKTGAVVLTSSDIAEGTNQYFTDARALAAAPAETTATVGALIAAADEKAIPDETDIFGFSDTAAGGILKNFTWAKLKAALKTYFDTLYEVKGAGGGTSYTDADAIKAPLPVNAYTTDRQLVIGDIGHLVSMESGAACSLDIPADSTVNFPVGTQIPVDWGNGAGQVTITNQVGVTVQSVDNMRKIVAKFQGVILHKIDANTWRIKGALTA